MPDNERFSFIDGLRGVAVLLVVFHHGYYFFVISAAADSLRNHGMGKLFLWVASRGFYGVHLFFVVSGFLITGLLMGFMDGKLDIGRFYVRRCFKILPHYYFVIMAGFVYILAVDPVPLSQLANEFFPFFLFLQNYIANVRWLDHTWSLVAEEQFYIFWAFFLFVLSKCIRTVKDRGFAALAGAVLVVVFVTLNRFILFHYGVSLVYFIPMTTHVTHSSSVIADGLMLGCVLRLVWFCKPEFFRYRGIACVSYALGILAFIFLFFLPIGTWGVPGYWYSVNFVWFFSIFFIMAGLGGVTWILNNPWLRWTGRNSYGIYIVHYPIALLLQSWFLRGGGYLFLIVYVFSAIGVGFVTTATIEKYFLDLRKKISP